MKKLPIAEKRIEKWKKDHKCKGRKAMADAQRFHELTGGCWHEFKEVSQYGNICKCNCLCGNLDEHIKKSNPTYSNAADILNRMKEFCGEEKFGLFVGNIGNVVDYQYEKFEFGNDIPTDYLVDLKYILNPPALLRKAVEFLEAYEKAQDK